MRLYGCLVCGLDRRELPVSHSVVVRSNLLELLCCMTSTLDVIMLDTRVSESTGHRGPRLFNLLPCCEEANRVARLNGWWSRREQLVQGRLRVHERFGGGNYRHFLAVFSSCNVRTKSPGFTK